MEEIEVRFLEIDKEALQEKLRKLGAEDKGERFFKEALFYDADFAWRDTHERVRVRGDGENVFVTYKKGNGVGMRCIEHEITANDYDQACALLQATGLVYPRLQEKYRHSYKLDDVILDIDTWPSIPTYVEIEGPSIESLQVAAERLGFDWEQRTEKDAFWVIKEKYGIDLHDVSEFTFEKFGGKKV